HFQYNGFFSLAILAIFFNAMGKTPTKPKGKGIDQFVLILIISILPSSFLSYLWQDPNTYYRVIAVAGSLLTLLSCFLFIRAGWSFSSNLKRERPATRALLILSLFSFVLKLFLQSITIFRVVGNAIFGNRPIIMGFLHLVLLGFVSIFIIAFYAKRQLLAPQIKLTSFAMICFAGGVVVNEVLLVSQGVTTIFGPAANLFIWLLWGAAIWLMIGTVLIAVARILTR
ncbi:MAG TPA: hypothetical protein VFV08_01820, partial [Puia sp.]|nr:hypothetical protein [Puia sp.]